MEVRSRDRERALDNDIEYSFSKLQGEHRSLGIGVGKSFKEPIDF